MRAIDTKVLVRLIARDDARQTQRAEAFLTPGAWVSHLVLAETVWVLESVYGLHRNAIAASVERLLDHAELTLQDQDVVAAALDNFHRNSRVGFSDALVLAIARKHGHLPLGSFDRNLARLDGVALP